MTHSDSRIAVYTGSFDPVTLGHLNVIERAARLVDTLIVGIGVNAEKAALFSPEERVKLVSQATEHIRNVVVRSFAGLAVEFVRQCGSRVMVRGVRPLTDLAGEFTMTMANKHLDPGIETVFLMADEEFVHVSSSLLKQIAPLADDDMLARFVPRSIVPTLRSKIVRQPQGISRQSDA
jgi:pantetheine-phosphate adenylyltransferase